MSSTTDVPARILLVGGGTQESRSRLQLWLQAEFPNYRCVQTATRDEVRHVAIHERIAIAFVDLDNPASYGMDQIRLVRTLSARAAAVALSSYHADSFRDYAIGAGAVTCLSPQVLDGTMKGLITSLLKVHGDGSTP